MIRLTLGLLPDILEKRCPNPYCPQRTLDLLREALAIIQKDYPGLWNRIVQHVQQARG